MDDPGRPGPKPKRLYVRAVSWRDPLRDDLPTSRAVRSFVDELDRVGRLVAHGVTTDPPGDLLLLRASEAAEATRVLRSDPYRRLDGAVYSLTTWNPIRYGAGVNLELPPGRGTGRLTQLQRVTVVVRDQEAALEWYVDVLGLTVRVHDRETGYIELALGKGAAALSLVSPRAEWGEPYLAEARGRIGMRTGIAFETDSVRALALRLENAHGRVTQRPEPQPWGGTTIRFVDPDGNEFLAFERTGRSPARPARGAPRRSRAEADLSRSASETVEP